MLAGINFPSSSSSDWNGPAADSLLCRRSLRLPAAAALAVAAAAGMAPVVGAAALFAPGARFADVCPVSPAPPAVAAASRRPWGVDGVEYGVGLEKVRLDVARAAPSALSASAALRSSADWDWTSVI